MRINRMLKESYRLEEILGVSNGEVTETKKVHSGGCALCLVIRRVLATAKIIRSMLSYARAALGSLVGGYVVATRCGCET